MSKLHLTKIAAAERQLRTAIRMFFAGEDELSVHTLTSAAYGLLKGIKADRGMNEAGDVYKAMLFYLVRDFRRGALPENITSDVEGMERVRALAEQMPIQPDTRFEDAGTVEISPNLAREFWNDRNRIANFLKHADRDPQAAISLDEVDNFQLLMQCYNAYVDVTKDDLGNEGSVFAGVSSPLQRPCLGADAQYPCDSRYRSFRRSRGTSNAWPPREGSAW